MDRITHSTHLEGVVRELEEQDPHIVYQCADFASHTDYTDAVDTLQNGIMLGLECYSYDPKAQIFWALGNDATTYYQYGLNVDDAISRLKRAIVILREIDDEETELN